MTNLLQLSYNQFPTVQLHLTVYNSVTFNRLQPNSLNLLHPSQIESFTTMSDVFSFSPTTYNLLQIKEAT